jgi:hypothetical protein
LTEKSRKPNKLKWNLQTVHSECGGVMLECFNRKLNGLNKQNKYPKETTNVTWKPFIE